jgi:hypothetical protein
MYKIKLWDEDKWNIHSSSYNPSKYGNSAAADKSGEGKAYHEQKYGSEGKSLSSDYLKKEGDKQDKSLSESNNANTGIGDSPEFLLNDEQKLGQKAEEEELPFKAAKQIFKENKNPKNATNSFLPESKSKTDVKTIEDAIKKAIEEEKKVIVMDG